MSAAILAGGKSRRFGSDKALARWKDSTMLAAAISNLEAYVSDILIVTKRPAKYAAFASKNVRVIKDSVTRQHPLSGIATALAASKTPHILITACDMPLLQPSVIKTLIKTRTAARATVAVWQGKPQPFPGVYAKTCKAAALTLLKQRDASIQELLQTIEVRFIKEQSWRARDTSAATFTDIDTPAQLANVQGQ
ncbi:MAG: molybdenum cofactor guanylyltransferase [Elusimicrobiota bacterium]